MNDNINAYITGCRTFRFPFVRVLHKALLHAFIKLDDYSTCSPS
jgi:hypothetical protein